MNILLLNTSDTTGGAAQACNRLYRALQQQGADVSFMVNEKSGNSADVHSFNENFFSRKIADVRFAAERVLLFPKLQNKKDLFFFSPANTGMDISAHPAVQQADIIHLHWLNQGFLSLASLQKLVSLKKKIVWTLHDMWGFTGGCHYARGCENFKAHCGNCPYLAAGQENDLSSDVWKKKHSVYDKNIFTFVTCSKWLAGIAAQSSLLKGFAIHPIPNPIDVQLYQPQDKIAARRSFNLSPDKFFILFASQNLADERKGFRYLREALELLHANNPLLRDTVELLVFGKSKIDLQNLLPLKVNALGSLSSQEKIVAAYNAANVFVLPSLEDNLPNTVMEALACGVPVVAFNTGGIPEMVKDGVNGFLAEQKSSVQLADAMLRIIQNKISYESFAQNARQKALENFTYEKVAKKYLELYATILKT